MPDNARDKMQRKNSRKIASAGGPLSNSQLERAAALLEEIDRLGKELWAVLGGDSEHHGATTLIGRVLLYVEEGLAVNPETHITPGELAAKLRTLISSG